MHTATYAQSLSVPNELAKVAFTFIKSSPGRTTVVATKEFHAQDEAFNGLDPGQYPTLEKLCLAVGKTGRPWALYVLEHLILKV